MLKINARGDNSFIHDPYLPAQLRLIEWVKSCIQEKQRLLVIELGVGLHSTPIVARYKSIILLSDIDRFPVEAMARDCKEYGRFIRINLANPEIPDDLIGLSFKTGVVQFMNQLTGAVNSYSSIPPEKKSKLEQAALELQLQSGLNERKRFEGNWLQVLEQLR